MAKVDDFLAFPDMVGARPLLQICFGLLFQWVLKGEPQQVRCIDPGHVLSRLPIPKLCFHNIPPKRRSPNPLVRNKQTTTQHKTIKQPTNQLPTNQTNEPTNKQNGKKKQVPPFFCRNFLWVSQTRLIMPTRNSNVNALGQGQGQSVTDRKAILF